MQSINHYKHYNYPALLSIHCHIQCPFSSLPHSTLSLLWIRFDFLHILPAHSIAFLKPWIHVKIMATYCDHIPPT